jgi:hypothetical protein
MCLIYNLRSISQAGRRGFDPRLPLFVINSFQPLCPIGRYCIKGLKQ